MPKPKPTLYCSFCGKSQHDVQKLIEVLGEDKEWCGREIVNLKRLRKQAGRHPPAQSRPEASRGWLGRFFR
jgi:ClpX C4-type zinc finger